MRTISCFLVAAIAAALSVPSEAAVLVEQTQKIDIPGMSGKMLGIVSKQARGDGAQTINAVDLERGIKAIWTGDDAQFFLLEEELVLNTSGGGKKCRVQSLQEMREAWESLGGEEGPFAAMKGQTKPEDPDEPAREFEVEIETEQRGTRVVGEREGKVFWMKATVHEKGLSIEESGGVIVETETVLAAVPEAKEMTAFNEALAAKLGEALGIREQMKNLRQIITAHPAIAEGMERIHTAGLEGNEFPLSLDTEATIVPDPRQPNAGAGSGDAGGPGKSMKSAFRGLRNKVRRKKETPATETTTTTTAAERRQAFLLSQRTIRISADVGSRLRWPESCQKEIDKR